MQHEDHNDPGQTQHRTWHFGEEELVEVIEEAKWRGIDSEAADALFELVKEKGIDTRYTRRPPRTITSDGEDDGFGRYLEIDIP